MENLSTMQPTEVLLTIASRRLEIEKMFTNTLPSELLDVFLKFLVKLCQTDFTLNETCIAVLSCSCQEHFLDQLSKHVLYLVASRKMVENVNQMLNDYILYMETIMSLFPQKISNTLEQIVTVNDMLMQFYESYDVLHCDTRIKEKFQNVKDHCQKQKMSQKKLEKEKSRNVDNVIEFNTEIINSEEFRKINIFPEIDDILGKRKYLIKPNIVNGAYDNVEHYLSIQFHLLREDFYSPLREGISDYLTSEIKLSRVNNVRIFKNVTFLMPIIFRTQIGYLINFGSNIRMSKMTWEDSKWFMYGSLLIFTSDNFNTVIFGTVIDSNAALLEKGLLIVSLKDIEIHDALFNREFLLMESEAYFEPYLQVLKVLQIIVEEAAEVMESHILASLTKECQHLILIGDHKQLRPSPAEYKLARDYNFDISLFERMINNGIPCDMLKLQHRMRPEISQLITPTIYPGLQNHSSVLKFEKIKGMLKSMFFFTHNYWEEKIEDSHSIRNIPEGNLVLGLCCYLVQQGEQASKITILATYAGQMFYLQKEQKKYSILKNVQITVVDNFQGEENDIILLSLVRSNKDAKIGFLKTENRVCVALSRARKGLYITIWPKIKEILESQEAIDSFITLRCQVHVSEFTTIRSLTDFSKVPNGCCTLICDDDLKCGHKCKQSCHLVDREHENYKLCDRNHKCMKICWEDCGDCKVHVDKSFPCGHTMSDECWKTRNCMALVDTILPLCGHEVKKPCYLKPEEFICTEPCEYRPLCGHSCVLNCHKSDDPDHLKYQCKKKCANFNKNCKEGHKCEKMCFEKCDNCVVLVQRTLSGCGHEAHIPCAEDPESYNCKANCEKILPCGHPCPLLCYENCGGCPVQVTVQLTDCQHTLEEVKCCEKDNIDCLKPCEKKLLCGHTCAGLCSEACTEMCMELVVSKVTPICGHVIEIPCYLQSEVCPESESILTRCQMPCEAILDCEHQCRGTCAGCRQGQVHQSCDERCEKILVCGHRCKLRCSDTCQPCTNRCLNSCEHMRCSRECGFPCIQCKEPCSWVCPHKKCTKLCSDICDRQPCNEACDKLLACLHPCIGFCGEPCPPFCSICNESDITEILGIKDNSSLRFVYLEDCGHTIEVKELENWLSASCREINFKRCPKCEVPIIKTRRYRNDVKRTFQHINLVKNNVHKALQEVESSQKDLIEELCLNYSKVIGLYEDFEEYKETYKMIKRKQESSFNLTDIISLTNLITVFVELSKYLTSYFHSLDEDTRLNLITLINKVLFSLRKLNYIGQKQLNDLNSELLRVHRLGDLISTKNNASKLMDKLLSREENEFKKVQLGIYFKSEIKKHYDAAYKIILSTQKFSKENDSKVCKSLKNLNLFDKTVEVVLGLEMISTYYTNDKFQEAENDEKDQTICTTVDTDINIFHENMNSMLSELNKIIEMNEKITFIVKEICTKLKFLREKIDSEKIKMVNFFHRVKDITNDNEFDAFSKHYKVLKNGVHQLMLSLTGLKTLHHQDYNPMLYELSDELNDAKNISQSPLRNGDRDSEFLERQEMKVTMVSDDRHFSTKAETLPNIFEDERTLSTTARKNEDGQEMIEGESMDMHKLEINCTLEKLSKAISTYLEIETQEKEKLEIKHTTDKLINSNILEIVKNAKLFQMYLNKVIKFVYGKSSVTKTEWEMYLHKALDIRRFIYLLVIERKQCLQHELVNLNEKLDFISTFYNWLQTFMDNPNAIEVIIDHELAQIAMLLAEINELELQNMPSKEKQNLQKTVTLVSHRLEIIRGKKTEISLVSGLRKELQCLLENISTNYFKLNKFESNFKKLTDIINKMSFIELIQNLCLGKVDVSYRCADLRCNIKKCSQKLEKMPFSDSSDLVKPYKIKMKETLRVLNARMNKVKSVDSKTDLTVKALGPTDYITRAEFCIDFQNKLEDDNDNFAARLVFSDECTFHLNGKVVNRHNVKVWEELEYRIDVCRGGHIEHL
ncbi:hypothetical protein C0J52_22821 [Blattella germanica]|nr:hypothetical protein C0J52_22821 [Blattella germanica]